MSPPQLAATLSTHLAHIEALLSCDICGDILRGPSLLACRHTFCSECIRRHLQTNSDCPSCRTTVRNGVADLRFSLALETLAEVTRTSATAIANTLKQLALLEQNSHSTEEPLEPSIPNPTIPRASKRKKKQVQQESCCPPSNEPSKPISIERKKSNLEATACQTLPIAAASAAGNDASVPSRQNSTKPLIAKKTRLQTRASSLTGPESIFGEADQIFPCPICQCQVRNRYMEPHISSGCEEGIESSAPAALVEDANELRLPAFTKTSTAASSLIPSSSSSDFEEATQRVVLASPRWKTSGISSRLGVGRKVRPVEVNANESLESPALVLSGRSSSNSSPLCVDELSNSDSKARTLSQEKCPSEASKQMDEESETEAEECDSSQDALDERMFAGKRKRDETLTNPDATHLDEQIPATTVESANGEVNLPDVVDSQEEDVNRERRNQLRKQLLGGNVKSRNDVRKPKPAVAYDTLKEAQLRKLLKDEGLRSTGDKSTLKKRHKEFLLLHNANLDSARPKPQSAIHAAMETWELTHGSQSNGAGSVAQGLGAVNAFHGHEASAEGRERDLGHVERYADEFRGMIEGLRDKKRLKVEAREKERREQEEKEAEEQRLQKEAVDALCMGIDSISEDELFLDK
ncbi:E3 ubiquitin-protein ligase rad18 [Chytriomyces hyalinus]|nr:E3 ubiquitin-protein ligase rad18 [Chytriomyces hyalinus]